MFSSRLNLLRLFLFVGMCTLACAQAPVSTNPQETPINEALKLKLERLKPATESLDQIKEGLAGKEEELKQSPRQKPLFEKLQAEYTALRRDNDEILKELSSSPKSDTRLIDKHALQAQSLKQRVLAFSTDSGRLNTAKYTLHQQSEQLTKEVDNPQQAPGRTLLAQLLGETSAVEQDASKISEKVTAQGSTTGMESAIADLIKRADAMSAKSTAFLEASSQFISAKSSLDNMDGNIKGWDQEIQSAKNKNILQKLTEGEADLQKRRKLLDDAITSEKGLTAAQRKMQGFSSRVQDFAQKVSVFSSDSQKLAASNSRLEEINQNLLAAEEDAKRDADGLLQTELARLRSTYNSVREELDQAQQGFSAPTPVADLDSRIRRSTARVDALDQQLSRFLNNGQILISTEALLIRAKGQQPTSLPISEITELSYGREALKMIDAAESKEKFVRPPMPVLDLFHEPHKNFIGIRSQNPEGQKRTLLIEMPGDSYVALIKRLLTGNVKLLVDSRDASYIPKELGATIVKPQAPAAKKGSSSGSPFGSY